MLLTYSILKMMRFLVFILFLFSFFSVAAQKSIDHLKKGDLIFQDSECGPLCIAINEVTPAIYGNHYSHIGLIDIEEGKVFVIEAVGDKVQKNSLEVFLARSEKQVLVGRVKKPFQKLIPEALTFAKQQMGIPYDDEFLYDNGKYYCSELIYDAFKTANQDTAFFQMNPMTFKSPKTNEFFPGWLAYYQGMDMEIPEGELGCNPGGLGQSDKIDVYLYP